MVSGAAGSRRGDETDALDGTLVAELEVQCTIKRAERTAFLCLLRIEIGPTMVPVDKKGSSMGCGRET